MGTRPVSRSRNRAVRGQPLDGLGVPEVQQRIGRVVEARFALGQPRLVGKHARHRVSEKGFGVVVRTMCSPGIVWRNSAKA